MEIPTEAELLERIKAFLERHKMAPTRFGREATGEPQLISSIEAGRSPSLKVVQRLAAFMAEKDAAAEPPTAEQAEGLEELARRQEAARGVDPDAAAQKKRAA